MALPGEQLGAVEPERLDANQHVAVVRCGDRTALNLENLGPARFVNHRRFHRGHRSPFSSYARSAWRIGGGKTVTGNLPLTVDLLEQEQFLVSLSAAFAGGMARHSARGIRSREHPVGRQLFDLSDIERDVKRDGLKHPFVGPAHRVSSYAGRTVLRHEHAVARI